MSNIRTFRDFRDDGPAYQPQRNFAPGPSQSYDANPAAGISMMAGDPDPSGLQPSCMDRVLPRRRWVAFTTVLSIFQVIMFIITLIVGGVKYDGAFYKGNKMAGPSGTTLYHMGSSYTPDIEDGAVWRLVTPIFLHAGLIHIASNLFFQLRLGYTLELRWTWPRFALVYLLTGIGASFWSAVLKPNGFGVGASGALFGITGADITYLIYNWKAIPHNTQEACFLFLLTVVNLLIGAFDDTIDNWAHFGGLMFGLFVGGWLPPVIVERPTEKLWRGGFLLGYIGQTILFACILWVNRP